jgi:hypothetical protein
VCHTANIQLIFSTPLIGRVCRGVELDPLYVDVVIRQYRAETGDALSAASLSSCETSRRWASKFGDDCGSRLGRKALRPLNPLSSPQGDSGVEIRHSCCLKIDREGQAVSQGSLCDNAD